MRAAPGLADRFHAPKDSTEFDIWDPANISPLVAYLSASDCKITGQVFGTFGGVVIRNAGWTPADRFEHGGRWDVASLREALKGVDGSLPPVTTTYN